MNCVTALAGALLAATAAPAFGQDAAQSPNFFARIANEIATFIDLGGPVILILMLVSVFGLAVALIKIAQFTLMHAGDHRFVRTVGAALQSGDLPRAETIIASKKGPVAVVMRAAIKGRRANVDERIVREEVERIAQAQIDSLDRGLHLIALVAAISPLLGLLGTVTGLIEAFQALAASGDRVDPAILASGIWEALLTTVMGLAIGIPAATIHLFMQRTVDAAAKRMEDAATQVFTFDLYRAQAAQSAAA